MTVHFDGLLRGQPLLAAVVILSQTEYTGIATSGALDRTASTSGYSLTASSGMTAVTSQPNELVVTFIGKLDASTVGTATNGFSEVQYERARRNSRMIGAVPFAR